MRNEINKVIEKRTTIEAKPARIKQAQGYYREGITEQPFNSRTVKETDDKCQREKTQKS